MDISNFIDKWGTFGASEVINKAKKVIEEHRPISPNDKDILIISLGIIAKELEESLSLYEVCDLKEA